MSEGSGGSPDDVPESFRDQSGCVWWVWSRGRRGGWRSGSTLVLERLRVSSSRQTETIRVSAPFRKLRFLEHVSGILVWLE